MEPNKMYVAKGDSDAVSVINVNKYHNYQYTPDKREPHDIIVGQDPGPMALNSNTRMIYVGNTGSGTVSVVNGYSNKLAAGVRGTGILLQILNRLLNFRHKNCSPI